MNRVNILNIFFCDPLKCVLVKNVRVTSESGAQLIYKPLGLESLQHTTLEKWQIQINVGLRLQIWLSSSAGASLIGNMGDLIKHPVNVGCFNFRNTNNEQNNYLAQRYQQKKWTGEDCTITSLTLHHPEVK